MIATPNFTAFDAGETVSQRGKIVFGRHHRPPTG
jgi:hypothetical protein